MTTYPGPAQRTGAALDCAHPDTGALLLRHVPPEAHTVAPRLDALAPHHVDALSGRKNPRPDIHGPIQPAEAEVLLRVWVEPAPLHRDQTDGAPAYAGMAPDLIRTTRRATEKLLASAPT